MCLHSHSLISVLTADHYSDHSQSAWEGLYQNLAVWSTSCYRIKGLVVCVHKIHVGISELSKKLCAEHR